MTVATFLVRHTTPRTFKFISTLNKIHVTMLKSKISSLRRPMLYCSASVQHHHRIISILSAVTFLINLLLFSYLTVSSALTVYDNDGGETTQIPRFGQLAVRFSSVRRRNVFTAVKRQTNSYESRSTSDIVSAHGGSILDESDPNVQFLCKGILHEYAACICNEDASGVEVACINAQFVDMAILQHLNINYQNAKKITFHGNNFQDLPDGAPLFGTASDDVRQPVIYTQLNVLNLSANYIVNLHSAALSATPNIQVLDLSNNEIVLSEENVHFLDHTPRLTHLYLRRAFTQVVNRTAQFHLMLQMFKNARLNELKFLDLSYNFLNSVPYELPCPFPSLAVIDLRQNLLRTISMNISCLASIRLIDLSRNHFQRLDERFREQFANYLPEHSLLLRNSFVCDCKSADYVQWIRSTNTIREKNLLVCARASPPLYCGTRLVEVPLHRLDCALDLNAGGDVSSLTRRRSNNALLSFQAPPFLLLFLAMLIFILW